jgi:ribosome-binding factor A
MPPTRRTIRVAEVVRHKLTELISREDEFKQALVTIVEINVTPDLRQAFVYFTALHMPHGPGKLLERFNKHRHAWQQAIGKAMQTKHTPRLYFRADPSIARGDRVMQLLDELDHENPPPAQ